MLYILRCKQSTFVPPNWMNIFDEMGGKNLLASPSPIYVLRKMEHTTDNINFLIHFQISFRPLIQFYLFFFIVERYTENYSQRIHVVSFCLSILCLLLIVKLLIVSNGLMLSALHIILYTYLVFVCTTEQNAFV